MRSRIGRTNREARKRHRRVWLAVSKNGVQIHAGFRYFLRYPEAESTPLKLGRKHSRRQYAGLTETVADSRKEARRAGQEG